MAQRQRIPGPLPEHVERPVLAQLQQDMIYAAGNPERQKQLMIDATRLFADGKLSRDTVGRFIDDANKFASWDPTVQRKLQAPEVERVRQTAGQLFMDGKSQSLYGSAARDALVAKQVVDGAVIEHLSKNPNATPHELGQIATKALEGVIPTLNPNIMGTGRAANLGSKVGEASRNLQNAQPQDGKPCGSRPALRAGEGRRVQTWGPSGRRLCNVTACRWGERAARYDRDGLGGKRGGDGGLPDGELEGY